jgi:hypothetical protein
MMADGNIVAARTRLQRAVTRMCEPRPAIHNHRVLFQPSLYDSLVADMAGTQGDTRTPAKSIPPLYMDAAKLRIEIDHQIRRWSPKPGSTTQRMQSLADHTWRPQDTDTVSGMSRTIDTWCDQITSLIDPTSIKHIAAPCPKCEKETVWRRDSAGDTVRQPALKLVTETGCTCQACGAHWEPQKYLFLCRLLGFELPEGVSE